MSEELIAKAVEVLSKEIQDDYNRGREDALKFIANGDLSLSTVEEYSEKLRSEYSSMRLQAARFLDESDSYLDGFTTACQEILVRISQQ